MFVNEVPIIPLSEAKEDFETTGELAEMLGRAYIVEDDEILFALLPFREFTNLMRSMDSILEEIEEIERLIGYE